MNTPRYHCEDCGYEFVKTEFSSDIEDSWLYCPICGRLDIQLLSGDEEGFTFVDPVESRSRSRSLSRSARGSRSRGTRTGASGRSTGRCSTT